MIACRGMLSTQRLACAVAALTIVASAWACSSFEVTPGEEKDASAPDVDETPEDVDAGFACKRIGQRIVERFDGAPSFRAQATGGGSVTVDGGELVATIDSARSTGNAQRAYYFTSVPIPAERAFGHARARFTFKGLVPPPAYVEAGCAIILHQQGTATSSAVRVELRPESMRLDDVAFLDGGVVDSGAGESLAPFSSAATDYAVTIDVKVLDDGGLGSTGSIPGNEPVSKTTPLLATIHTVDLHCGIDSANIAEGTYTVRLDDVEIDLCSR